MKAIKEFLFLAGLALAISIISFLVAGAIYIVSV